MTKGNNGKAARRRAMKQLLCLSLSILTFTVVFLCFGSNNAQEKVTSVDGHTPPRRLGNRNNKQKQHSHHHYRGTGVAGTMFDETGKDPHEVAVRFRSDLLAQAETKDEAAFLEDILEGRLHLVDIIGVEQELERAPLHSYAGVYGKFCRLNFAIHKANPSSGKLIRSVEKGRFQDDRPHGNCLNDVRFSVVPNASANDPPCFFFQCQCFGTLWENRLIVMIL